ncbi:hypothetical protein CEXT_222701 [Caerostris extrusa]|uniref:Uncharacterized protein n=1 Tax=Caerostris extrusa TaxID=172846 RepID=A0AAV4Q152_CAEEX|nr:hypothetical protein CEXT_222701 [Caerostris extrusa]
MSVDNPLFNSPASLSEMDVTCGQLLTTPRCFEMSVDNPLFKLCPAANLSEMDVTCGQVVNNSKIVLKCLIIIFSTSPAASLSEMDVTCGQLLTTPR